MTRKPATKKASEALKPVSFFFEPLACYLCQDVLIEQSSNVSLLRIAEMITTSVFPAVIPMWFVSEFAYNLDVERIIYESINPIFDLKLTNPSGQTFLLLEGIKPSKPHPDVPLTVQRMLIDLTGRIHFLTEGRYTFVLEGRFGDAKSELLMKRSFLLKKN